jgi:DNA-directed RNA polymerase specialized sigma subunit
MSKYISPELYHKYKHQVLEMSPAIQYYEGTIALRESSSLSDQEIADRLGLDAEDVTEIRCIAEIDLLPADTWIKSDNWKREMAQKPFKKRWSQRK